MKNDTCARFGVSTGACAGMVGVVVLLCATASAVELQPGQVTELDFAEPEVPPSLYSMFTGESVTPTLAFRVPEGYDPDTSYPLLVYVPGLHGGRCGNIGNAQTIAGSNDWIVASLPLFQKQLDREEFAGGIVVGFEDYATISRAYAAMLGRLFELVPNIDFERSAMVGFSNGAITIAVLLSGHDEFVLSHFRSFCLVDQGMFHLSDLHKKGARDARYLILAGDDQRDLGRDLKIRGGQLLEDSWRLIDVDISFHVLQDTGHELRDEHMAAIGRWVRGEAFAESDAPFGVRRD